MHSRALTRMLLQPPSPLVDPGSLLTRQEATLADVVCHEGGARLPVPVLSGDQRLGAMDPIPRGLDVHSRVAFQ